MNCPRCGAEMEEGRLRFQQLGRWFGPRDASGKFVFLTEQGDEVVPKLGAVSYYCRTCDTLVAPGAYDETLKCFECNRDIEQGAESCAHCGWTWK